MEGAHLLLTCIRGLFKYHLIVQHIRSEYKDVFVYCMSESLSACYDF
jgi:hypothetical protein